MLIHACLCRVLIYSSELFITNVPKNFILCNSTCIFSYKEFTCSIKSYSSSKVSVQISERVWNAKGLIRIRKSKKNRQHNGQKKKNKRTSNDLQNTTHKAKDWITRTPLTTGGELRCSGRVGSSCSTGGTRRVTLLSNPVISHEWGKNLKVFTTSGTYPR